MTLPPRLIPFSLGDVECTSLCQDISELDREPATLAVGKITFSPVGHLLSSAVTSESPLPPNELAPLVFSASEWSAAKRTLRRRRSLTLLNSQLHFRAPTLLIPRTKRKQEAAGRIPSFGQGFAAVAKEKKRPNF